jgi:pilus assembly protein TadC
MIVMAAMALTALAVLVWPTPVSPGERLRTIRRSPSACDMADGSGRDVPLPGLAVAVPAGFVVFLLVGGIPGAVAGVLVAGGVLVMVSRREPAEVRRRRERTAADLPFAADLVAACLRAGQPLSGAIETTADALGGPLGERLSWVAARVRLGADPEDVWAAVASEPPLGALARTMIRAAQSGAPIADALTRLADDARDASRAASAAAARKVGVQAVAPLGLCFLPAFVFLGIVPVVAGLATQILLP